MTIDERVRDGLSALAGEVRPAPDPMRRLHARRRRSRSRRGIAAALAVAVALGGWLIWLRPDSGVVDQARPLTARQEWVWRLVDSPARGSLAGDAAFVQALGAAVTKEYRGGSLEIPATSRSAKLLFADDVDGVRVALAAFADERDESADVAAAWMAAPRGATADTLAAALRRGEPPAGTDSAVTTLTEPFQPVNLRISGAGDTGVTVSLSLAPAGCQVASAPLPSVTEWQTEPTRSYVVRSPATQRGEWWRVTCDGAVRYLAPAPMSLAFAKAGASAVGEPDLDNALRDARGTVDRELARNAIWAFVSKWGYDLADMPRVVWGGVVSGNGRYDARVVVLAAPKVGGGWIGDVCLFRDIPGTGGTTTGRSFAAGADPSQADVLVLRVSDAGDDPASPVLVVTPAAAVGVRVLHNGLSTAAMEEVRDDAAVLRLSTVQNAVVHAVDANGQVIGMGSLAPDATGPRHINAWD
jgi:hypothetical protein